MVVQRRKHRILCDRQSERLQCLGFCRDEGLFGELDVQAQPSHAVRLEESFAAAKPGETWECLRNVGVCGVSVVSHVTRVAEDTRRREAFPYLVVLDNTARPLLKSNTASKAAATLIFNSLKKKKVPKQTKPQTIRISIL